MNRILLQFHQIIALFKSIMLIGLSATWHLWSVTQKTRRQGVKVWLSDVRYDA